MIVQILARTREFAEYVKLRIGIVMYKSPLTAPILLTKRYGSNIWAFFYPPYSISGYEYPNFCLVSPADDWMQARQGLIATAMAKKYGVCKTKVSIGNADAGLSKAEVAVTVAVSFRDHVPTAHTGANIDFRLLLICLTSAPVK